MKKIIYITNVRLPTEKAHGLQVMKSCEAFVDSGIDVKLIVPNLRTTIREDPFDYYSVKKNFPLKKVFVLEIQPYFKWLGDWIAHVQGLSFIVTALVYSWYKGYLHRENLIYSRDKLTLLVLSILNLPAIAEIHDYRPDRRKWSYGVIFSKAKKIVINSKGTLERLEEHYDIDHKKLIVAPNGVDPEFFSLDKTKEEARRALELPMDKVIIAYVGRLETVGKEKGVSDILKAFKLINRDNLLLCIIGGPEELKNKYSREVEDMGIQGSTIFLGQIKYNKVPLYLRAIDIVTIPTPGGRHSLTTSPIKLFESLASGKAIVAADIPAFRQYLNENNSLLFEPDNIKSFSEKIKDLINDKALLNRLSNQAKADAQNYTWIGRAGKILKFISSRERKAA